MTLIELILNRTQSGKIQWTGPHAFYNRYPEATTVWACTLRMGRDGAGVVLNLWKRENGTFFLTGWSGLQAAHQGRAANPHGLDSPRVIDVEATREELQGLKALIEASLDLNDLDIIRAILGGL